MAWILHTNRINYTENVGFFWWYRVLWHFLIYLIPMLRYRVCYLVASMDTMVPWWAIFALDNKSTLLTIVQYSYRPVYSLLMCVCVCAFFYQYRIFINLRFTEKIHLMFRLLWIRFLPLYLCATYFFYIFFRFTNHVGKLLQLSYPNKKTPRKYRFSVRSRVEQTIWWTQNSKIHLSYSKNIFVWWILHWCVIRVPYLWLSFRVICACRRENEPKMCIESEGNGKLHFFKLCAPYGKFSAIVSNICAYYYDISWHM